MWSIENHTPFAADRAWVRDRNGAEIWLVAIKATFTIEADGSTSIAGAQPPVNHIPVHTGAPAASSLMYDSDLPRTKPTTDIIVNGEAHSPDGKPVRELDVSFSIGTTTKTLKVYGDRQWRGKTMTDPEPFVTMPLIYERAYGGIDPSAGAPAWDSRNPVGQGFATSQVAANGRRLPNVEHPSRFIRSWHDRPEPAGFGALCPHWEARRRLAGTYDERWQKERLPLLPDDFDDRHYQCAPADQQSPQHLRGGEEVVLRNLAPGSSTLRFCLPRLHLACDTFFFRGDGVRHEPPQLHTVIVEPEVGRVSLVWHTALPCHARVLKLSHTRIRSKEDLRAGALGRAA